MIPRFRLARPATLEEAFGAIDAAGGDAAYIAGGTELLQVMKMGFAQFGTLVDLKGIPELHGIDEAGGELRIGATTTHREVERSPEVAAAFPALVDLVHSVANARVRSTGTLGGNLAFAEPHSDPATLLLACDATLELAGPGGRRETTISEFVVGPLTTSRDPDEVLVRVRVPRAGEGEGRAYAKLAFFERPAASVAVRLTADGGVIRHAVVAVGSLTEIPELVPGAAAALVGTEVGNGALDEAIAKGAAELASVDAVEDLNGSPDYKRHLAGVLFAKTARAAIEEATSRG
jgi:carbon-monoxide dehydrogenase medium subunit